MKTLVVFDDETKEILCCIPDEREAICKKVLTFLCMREQNQYL